MRITRIYFLANPFGIVHEYLIEYKKKKEAIIEIDFFFPSIRIYPFDRKKIANNLFLNSCSSLSAFATSRG